MYEQAEEDKAREHQNPFLQVEPSWFEREVTDGDPWYDEREWIEVHCKACGQARFVESADFLSLEEITRIPDEGREYV